MDLQKAEQIGKIYFQSNDVTISSTVISLLYQEVIRQRGYIKIISDAKWEAEKELEYCILELEKVLENKK